MFHFRTAEPRKPRSIATLSRPEIPSFGSLPGFTGWQGVMPRSGADHVRLAISASALLADFAAATLAGLAVSAAFPGLGANVVLLVALCLAGISTIERDYNPYNLRMRLADPRVTAQRWALAFTGALVLVFLARAGSEIPRTALGLFFVAGLPVLLLARAATVSLAQKAAARGRLLDRRLYLVGSEAEVSAFERRHAGDRTLRVVGATILRDTEGGLDEDLALAVCAVRLLQPDDVFLLMPWTDPDRIERCADALMTVPAALHLRPELALQRFSTVGRDAFGGHDGLRLTSRPLSRVDTALKRAMDLSLSIVGLVALAPVLALVALAIRIDSPGPVFFRQRRYGFNQQAFRIWKFRTMTVTEDRGVVQAQRNDKRITRVGAVLRRLNIDELPQLINVIAGDMSLVGPRPHALEHDRTFERRIALYARRHNVKPGITGWAQVNGCRGETPTDAPMRQRVVHDLHYIDNWSLWLDVKILFLTVLSRKSYRNAY